MPVVVQVMHGFKAASVRQQQTLLVVDDQPTNILVLHQALSEHYRVLKASNGSEALQVCRTHRPDLVLLDVVMPDIDGFEVCRELKADPGTRDIPIIFVTAHDDVSHETLGLELGAVDFIAKPINAAVVRARVKAHLGFARSSSLLAATLESSADGILVTDLAGGVSSMNQAFIRMWKLPAALVGDVSRDAVFAYMFGLALVTPDVDADQWLASLRRTDPMVGVDALQLVGDRQVERYVTPLHVNGSLRGYVFSFRDVTERWRAANDLRRLNESLESRILERTQELAHTAQLAQAAGRAKSDFLSNMSHEIRTPMNAIIGMAFLALKTSPSPKQRNFLEKIHRAGQHLQGLVNDTLDFSKIEAGKLHLEETDFHVSGVFDSVASQTADAAKAKGLRLTFEIDPSLSRAMRGDPLRVGQVLLNFVGNAIKFTLQGEVHVRATTEQRFDAESLLRFEVRDTGIGLSDDQIAQLFQKFHQVDTSTTRNYGGSGLGLAVCKQLAELMGGAVGVCSRLGQGSTFWFNARVRFAQPGTLGLPLQPAAQPLQDPRVLIHGARILLVEDNLMNQEVAAGLLEDVGAEVVIANHGQEAIDRVHAERFDCVLMDVQMPVMDGLQATRLIRMNPAFVALPVLAMTANARSEDRARCLEAGMNGFLTKPVLPDQLYAMLAAWVTRRPGTTAPGEDTAAAKGEARPPEPAAAAPAGDPQFIDLSILSRSVGGDAQKVRRYATLFVDAMSEAMPEFEAALGLADMTALADLGHRMKSSSRMVGALGLATLCESLEGLRHSAAVHEAQAIVQKMPLMLASISADIEASL